MPHKFSSDPFIEEVLAGLDRYGARGASRVPGAADAMFVELCAREGWPVEDPRYEAAVTAFLANILWLRAVAYDAPAAKLMGEEMVGQALDRAGLR